MIDYEVSPVDILRAPALNPYPGLIISGHLGKAVC
jgi:hypothetical protein